MAWVNKSIILRNHCKSQKKRERAHARAASLATAEKRLTLLQVLDCAPVWDRTGVLVGGGNARLAI